MDVNVPLLRKTLEWAYEQHLKAERGEPSEWNQSNWILTTECGTVCCIAGKITIDAGWTPVWGFVGGGEVVRRDGISDDVSDDVSSYASDVATRELGLTEGQAQLLFSGANTIEDLYSLAGQFTDGEVQPPPELDLSAVRDSDPCSCSCGCGEPSPFLS